PGMQLIEARAELFEKNVGLRQVFARRSFALVQIRNGVETECVDAEVHPELEHFEERVVDRRIIEIQIGLMRIEAMPIVRMRNRIPRPIRRFEILEDDSRVLILFRRVAPDVIVAPRRSRFCPARLLKPWMLIAGVIDDELGDYANPAAVRLTQERFVIGYR